MSEDKAETNSTGISLPVTATAQVAKDLMELAKNDTNTVEAAKNFGESAVIVSNTVKNCLLPLAALNFGIDKAKAYFQHKFAKDLEEKTKNISPEKIVEPKASIVGPALQGLAFCHEEHILKEMYLNLISSAMNSDKKDKAHPAFVEVIKQLNSTEAKYLKVYISENGSKHLGRVKYINSIDDTYFYGYRNIVNLSQYGNPVYDPELSSYIDNWVRLGLIEVGFDKTLLDNEGSYEIMKLRDDYLKDELAGSIGLQKDLEKGYIDRTAFGASFAKIIGIDNN